MVRMGAARPIAPGAYTWIAWSESLATRMFPAVSLASAVTLYVASSVVGEELPFAFPRYRVTLVPAVVSGSYP